MWLLFVLATSAVPVLSGTFPSEVPSGASIATWEQHSGSSLGPTGHRISYELLVDPKRMAIYTITRFRVHDARKADPGDETMIWFARVRDTRCYRRVRLPDGDGQRWEWRTVPSGTAAFEEAMIYARAVYQLNRAREIAEEAKRARE